MNLVRPRIAHVLRQEVGRVLQVESRFRHPYQIADEHGVVEMAPLRRFAIPPLRRELPRSSCR